jgi:hypothetical protein
MTDEVGRTMNWNQVSKKVSIPVLTQGRGTLDYLRNKYKTKNVQEGYLRIGQQLTNSQMQYSFNPLVVGNEAVTDVKLDKNDIFAVTRIGLFLSNRTLANPGNEQLLTFPAGSSTSGAPAGLYQTGVNINDLYCIYNGFLNIVVNTVQIYDKLDTMRFLYVPNTQSNSQTGINATPAYSYNFANEREYNKVFYPLKNLLELSGAGQNQISLNIPGYTGMGIQGTTTTTTANFVSLYFDGFLVKNVAYNR